MATVISKEEFLKACNQKLAIDNQKQEEERRRQEEERRRQEEERKRREEEERRRQEEENRKRQYNAEWDAWYRTLPASCKRSFTFNGFQYSVDAQNRRTTKTPLLGDPRDVMLGDPRDRINPRDLMDLRIKDDVRANVRFSGFINEELGLI